MNWEAMNRGKWARTTVGTTEVTLFATDGRWMLELVVPGIGIFKEESYCQTIGLPSTTGLEWAKLTAEQTIREIKGIHPALKAA